MTREYELVLMLDPEAPDGRRDEVAGETRKRIESAGALKHADTWGTRKMAFEIRRRTEADYRFYRFEAESDLLDQLDHALKITDGVLRFRIFKVDSGTPTISPPPAAQSGGGSARGGRPGGRREATERKTEPAAEAEPAEAPEEPAEPAEPAEPPQEPAEPAEAEPESTPEEQPG